MSIDSLVSAWRANPEITSNIAAWQTLPARPARVAEFPSDLYPRLVDSLRSRGIEALYVHQAAAWKYARLGEHVVIVTGTASGKTLCYNLPVLDSILRNPAARALYLFPTKALAQDQVAALQSQFASAPIATYDGDTPTHTRAGIRANARIIVSNPDMLHTGILPHHTLWADFFHDLKFVVIDEMHTYRGVFGSHVANVIRRLKRVTRIYDSTPQFILTSATIANPVELAERLIEERVALVDDDGAAKSEKHFVIYNPPVINRALGLRRSALQESVRLARNLFAENVQAIIFARARRTVELILRYLASIGSDVENEDRAIRGYRSGYLPTQRREIEHGLREGIVRIVVATNALELGIDIGEMGAAVLVGYPGTIAATWQQAGRAGRKDETSLAILIASASPLDQFLAHHPEYFFARSPEQALVNPDNLLILLHHLRCAAFEAPFRKGEQFGRVEGSRVSEFLDVLKEGKVLHESGDQYFWMADAYPADSISLRSASAERVVLQVDGVVIGEMDRESAYWMVHPQAVYLHEGESYHVDDLDLTHNIARLSAVQSDYYTEPRSDTTVQLLDAIARAEVRGATKAHGEIAVTTQVIGFKKVKWFTNENLGTGDVVLPPTELHTTGYWLALNDETVETLRARGMWTNDANDYGPNWQKIRDRVRARDAFRCQGCRALEDGPAHHVHHKIPLRAFDSVEQANQFDNLITLCPNCHQRAEAVVRIRSGLAGLGHVLGHLAPFFLMCDARDIGVHSDPQSPLAEGKPSVVIYDQIPAGIGFSERLFELHDDLMARALELVAQCECEDGCPSCVGPGGESGYGGKRETKVLLDALT